VTDIPRLDPVKYLLLRKFGSWALFISEAADGAETAVESQQEIREFQAYLETLSEYELSKRFKDEQARELFDEHRFNSPSAQADFEHWV
jgi:hypothetical protein